MNSYIYLYLARRDKQSLRLLSVLGEGIVSPTKVTDIKTLGLNESVMARLLDCIHAHRMDWETWMESATSYEDLCKKAVRRGYRPPAHMKPLCPLQNGTVRKLPRA